LLALENEGITVAQPGVEVFFVVEDAASRDAVLQALAELRRTGISADTDYAGRSLKGQMTQAGRSGAHTVVIVRAGAVTIKRTGRDEQVVGLGEVVATLTA
jgi:histidyl-tRNA synthetase